MLRTSVFEVVKTDEMESLIECGLLENVDDFFDKIELAKCSWLTIAAHNARFGKVQGIGQNVLDVEKFIQSKTHPTPCVIHTSR